MNSDARNQLLENADHSWPDSDLSFLKVGLVLLSLCDGVENPRFCHSALSGFKIAVPLARMVEAARLMFCLNFEPLPCFQAISNP